MIQRSFLLMMTALVCSSGVHFNAGSPNLGADITSKDIGYPTSPNSTAYSCLVPLSSPDLSVTLFYNSALQPAIAVNPTNANKVVAVWQQDCLAVNSFFIVGENWPALELGVGYSGDGGLTWNRVLVPYRDCNGGIAQGVRQGSLAYSSDGKKLYLVSKSQNITTVTDGLNQAGITASVSSNNGASWSTPQWVVASGSTIFDCPLMNPSVAASLTSRNTAFIVYESVNSTSKIEFSKTVDGGKIWSPPIAIYDPTLDLNRTSARAMFPSLIELPNGDLLCFMSRYYYESSTDFLFDISCIRSTDGGATWNSVTNHVVDTVLSRTYVCPSGSDYRYYCQAMLQGYKTAINPSNGNLYVVFPYLSGSGLPQIGLSVSNDNGITWSNTIQVNRTPSNAPNPQAFTASVAVNDRNRVGILYHDFRNSPTSCQPGNTATDAWLAIYEESSGSEKLKFIKEARLSNNSYVMENGPDYMYIDHMYATNGDYNNIVANGKYFYGLHIQSLNGPFSPPQQIPTIGYLMLDNNRRTAPFFNKINGN